jgi:outer membrane protein assembly factor BamB
LVASLLSLVFVVPAFLTLEHKELILAPNSAKAFIIIAALGSPLVFALVLFACYLFGNRCRSETAHSVAQIGSSHTAKRHVVLTVTLGLAAALLPFMLLIYRAAGYQMPDRHIWNDRVKPDVSWWIIGLYLLVVLITIGGCRWKLIRDERAVRFAWQKFFFVAAVLLGIAFFVRSGYLREKEFVHAVVCVNRDSSKILWTCEGLTGRTDLQSSRTVTHASATPVTDGEHVFGYFGEGGLMSVSPDGKLLWKMIKPLFDSKYGAATSPVMKDNILVITSDVAESSASPSSITAFDCISGRPLWKKLRKSHKDFATYGTPLVKAVEGKRVAIVQGWYDIKGYDLRTGQELWSYPLIHEGNHLVASLTSDSRCLYVMGAKQISALDISRLGTCNDPLLWSAPILGEKSSTPVVVNGLLFLVTEAGIAYCLEAQTGQVLWKNRLNGRYYSSVITMGDKVLFTNESGQTTVVAVDKDFRELTRNALGELTYASLAPAGNQLFIRTYRHLYCIQESR